MTAPVRRMTLGGITAAVAAIVSVITWAAPGDGGVATTCYNKSKATWRPIDTAAGQTCLAGEQMLKLYTQGGADNTFLGKTAQAADSAKLGGTLASAFLTKADAANSYLGVNGTAANADLLDNHDSSEFVTASSGTAYNSQRLGGLDASAYLTSTSGTVANSDKLDGIDSTGFVQGHGSYQRFAVTTANANGTPYNFDTAGGRIELYCFAGGGDWQFRNTNSGRRDAWIRNGTTGALSFQSIASGGGSGSIAIPSTGEPQQWTLVLLDDSGNSATIDIWALMDYQPPSFKCKVAIQSQF